MNLIEVLIATIVFSLFSFGVMSQLNTEGKLYLHRIDTLYKMEDEIRILQIQNWNQ